MPDSDNRPDHPFFWESVQAVNDNDNEAEEADAFDVVLRNLAVDRGSVLYMAKQRSLRALKGEDRDDEERLTPCVVTWVDGFLAAMRLMRNRQAQPQDGQHRG